MNHSENFIIMPRAYGAFASKVLAAGERVQPRGIPTYEVLGATAVLRNPLDRVVTSPQRKNNLGFGVFEWLSLMTGEDDIELFKLFISSYGQFSRDGIHLDGCYGTRMNYRDPQTGAARSQLAQAILKLKSDEDSRQAVVAFYQREDLTGLGGNNTPCTLNAQFLIRDGKLHLIINMRSSDVIKGLTYDVFMFTMMQEFVARYLGLGLGVYLHRAGSLHVYETDVEMVKHLDDSPRWPHLMQPMPQLGWDDLKIFRSWTRAVLHKPSDFGSEAYLAKYALVSDEAYHYLKQLVAVMVLHAHRNTLTPEQVRQIMTFIKNRTLRTVTRQTLVRAGAMQPWGGAS